MYHPHVKPSMRTWHIAAVLMTAGSSLQVREQLPRDWIDRDTGHRVVRLTDADGGSTLYFHDNAFSRQGDKLIFNTPNGFAMIDVTRIGTDGGKPEIVAPGARRVFCQADARSLLQCHR